ncbi:hypothetical protein HMPREF0733_10113 [Rothia dentocariosa ATCC 17931]|uniref:Uncharacterized protein n=1 Tax=Rothia dentocariosa (strain ATCC 17931 / CDC X599 / XDIA) TaxID=762948 RepID=E3H4V2_ROTDC|nr:hypothetical protein HMPREF0733_10113 [Rothia dentocariosa ATCC 17931]
MKTAQDSLNVLCSPASLSQTDLSLPAVMLLTREVLSSVFFG